MCLTVRFFPFLLGPWWYFSCYPEHANLSLIVLGREVCGGRHECASLSDFFFLLGPCLLLPRARKSPTNCVWSRGMWRISGCASLHAFFSPSRPMKVDSATITARFLLSLCGHGGKSLLPRTRRPLTTCAWSRSMLWATWMCLTAHFLLCLWGPWR